MIGSRKFIPVLILLLAASAFRAPAQQIRDILIDVSLTENGTAKITERWDVEARSGTEWYLVRDNLSDIKVRNLNVSENGKPFRNIGEWNTSGSLAQKKGLCGIVHKNNGVEICWGLGSYGDHIFTVSYEMTLAVKSLQDYDCFHIQLVSPGLSSSPRHVKATIRVQGKTLQSQNTAIWAFGFEGSCNFCNGEIVYESSEEFRGGSSLISLVRLDKGILSPESVRDYSFSKVLETAMEGASFDKEDQQESLAATLTAILSTIFFPLATVFLLIFSRKRERRKILGDVPKKEIGWFREPPYKGNPVCAYEILSRLGEIRKSNSLASALILKMIYNGNLSVSKDSKGRIEISFNDSVPQENLNACARTLYDMMKEASGKDLILQDKEFSRWSSRHGKKILEWVNQTGKEAGTELVSMGCKTNSGNYTPLGQKMAREAIGFRKYLKDFTLIDEKTVPEVVLWKDYLIFGALFGIADKVASELRNIDPAVFEQTMVMDYSTIRTVIYMSDSLSRSITNTAGAAASAASGMGGHSSFGGGGGFSGGGFGGGCR